ncbi:MAG: hypothetical protein K6E51_10415 [Treponema sp.]|nr:hypothetical protein [Treponema sp.]
MGKITFNCKPDDEPKAILDEVCRQICMYYKGKENFTCLKRKLRWKNPVIQCEFGFCSSHSNMRGEWVNFEIIPTLYAIDNDGMEKKGLLYLNIWPENFDICHINESIFFKIIEYIEDKIQLAQEMCTKEGFSAFLERYKDIKFIAEARNNQIFLEKLKN